MNFVLYFYLWYTYDMILLYIYFYNFFIRIFTTFILYICNNHFFIIKMSDREAYYFLEKMGFARYPHIVIQAKYPKFEKNFNTTSKYIVVFWVRNQFDNLSMNFVLYFYLWYIYFTLYLLLHWFDNILSLRNFNINCVAMIIGNISEPFLNSFS